MISFVVISVLCCAAIVFYFLYLQNIDSPFKTIKDTLEKGYVLNEIGEKVCDEVNGYYPRNINGPYLKLCTNECAQNELKEIDGVTVCDKGNIGMKVENLSDAYGPDKNAPVQPTQPKEGEQCVPGGKKDSKCEPAEVADTPPEEPGESDEPKDGEPADAACNTFDHRSCPLDRCRQTRAGPAYGSQRQPDCDKL